MHISKITALIGLLLLTSATAYVGLDIKRIKSISTERQQIVEDRVDMRHVRFGLFNEDSWKSNLGPLIDERLSDFEIPAEAKAGIQDYVEDYLYQFYDQEIASGKIVDQFISADKGQQQPIKFMGVTLDIDINDIIKKELTKYLETANLRGQIPGIAQNVSSELGKNEEQIKAYLKAEIERLADISGADQWKHPLLTSFKETYDCNSLEECVAESTSRIDTLEDEEQKLRDKILIIVIVILLGLILPLLIWKSTWWRWVTVPIGTVLALVLLWPALTMPMIDILAELPQVRLNLLGADIIYGDQVLFYQSKSILEVVQLLLETSQWDSRMVGYLILAFSILFPIVKTICTIISTYIGKKDDLFFKAASYLGKWSMADVFVVALFMAYIGFNGMITGQMNQFAGSGSGYDITTYDETTLRPGALFFAGFVLVSLIISTTLVYFKKREGKIE